MAADSARIRRRRAAVLVAMASVTFLVLGVGGTATARSWSRDYPETASGPNKSATTTGSTTATSTPRAAGVWKPEFDEKFNRDAEEGKFLAKYHDFTAYKFGWKDTSKRGTYDPGIVSVSGGHLLIHVHTDSAGRRLVAALVPKINGGSKNQRYGRYLIRFQSDSLPGYKLANLLWPESDDWSDGEIDFPEGDLNGAVGAFNHHPGDPNRQDAFSTTKRFSAWHTAITEWSPGRVRFILDGKVLGTARTHVMDTSSHPVIQAETRLTGGAPAPGVDGYLRIDEFKAWSYSG